MWNYLNFISKHQFPIWKNYSEASYPDLFNIISEVAENSFSMVRRLLVSSLEQTCCIEQLMYAKRRPMRCLAPMPPHSVLAPSLQRNSTSYSTSCLSSCFSSSSSFSSLCTSYSHSFSAFSCSSSSNPAVWTTWPCHWSAARHGWLTEPSVVQPVHYVALAASVDGSMPRIRTALHDHRAVAWPVAVVTTNSLDVSNFFLKKHHFTGFAETNACRSS